MPLVRRPLARPLRLAGLPALLLLPLLVALGSPPARASALPPGFSLRTVAQVPRPTALAFLPDGRGLVTTQPGQLRVLRAGGGVLATPALDLTARICADGERGLLGVAVDPGFASNGWVYLFWTRRTGATCGAARPLSRVSRFTMSGDRLAPGSERVLADAIPAGNGHHISGDLGIAADGLLYVSVGDGMCQLTDASRCAGDNGNARRLDIPLGKILRLTRTGGIPAGNPYAGAAGARRCTRPAGPEPGSGPCAETYASGLRNPFRFAVRPGSSEIWVNDVGQSTWEEVNRLQAGADYGWNACEGPHAQGATAGGCPMRGATGPLLAYGHTDGCGSITGGAFVPGGAFGPARRGAYLYADYVCGKIFERRADGSVRTFLSGLGKSSAVDLAFGPYAGTQALYFLSYAGGGAVHRVVRTAAGSPPVAALAVTGTDPATRTVRFDGSASYDPDGGDRVVSWRWSFGDGTSATTTTPTVSHTYAGSARVTAALRVVDTTGAVSEPARLAVSPAGAAPVVTITGSPPGARYAVADRPLLSATVRDAEDGEIEPATVRWSVLLHHVTTTGDHTHPRESTIGASIRPGFPAPEDLAAAQGSFLEVRASATDADGVTTTKRLNLLPRKVALTFASSPTGRAVTVNGERLVAPRTVTAWAGWRLNLTAPDQPGTGGTAICKGWSDGGACAHQVVTPGQATTYTARFTR